MPVRSESKAENRQRLMEIVEVVRRHEIVKEGMTPKKLCDIIEELGPTFIKLGQILSMRSDILPKEYCEALKKLRSSVAPMPYSQVVSIVERSYGRPMSEVFSSFDEHALGSASIAQAHAAVLCSGESVVVKVQREGIHDIMSRDIMLLKQACKLLKYAPVGGLVDFNQVLDEMWIVAQEEMNFQTEAANLERFHALNQDVAFVASPLLYREYTTTHVLVMERIDGVSIDNHETLLAEGYDLSEIGAKLADNYVRQIMTDGFFHADPHPGNIFVMEGNVIGFIDFGMVGALTPRDLDFLADFAIGFVSRNSDTISHALVTLCGKKFFEHREELKFEIHQMMMQYTGIPIETINFAGAIQNCVDIIVKYKLQIPSGIFMLIKALATLEKFATSLDPSLALAPVIVPYAKEVVKGKYSPRRIASEIYDTLNNYVSFIRDFPNDVSEILYKLKEGKIKHDVILDDNTLFIKTIRMVSRRIAYVIMLIGLFIGSIVLIVFDRDNGYGHFILIATSILILLQMLKWLFSIR